MTNCNYKNRTKTGQYIALLQMWGVVVLFLGGASTVLAASSTLQNIRARGVVTCGVNPELQGFSKANSLGVYSGLDVDLCRGLASAIFADSDAAEFVPVTAPERFTALLNNAFDVLVRNTTWTLDRNARYGIFAGVNYYDGQGFMVPKQSGVRSALELDNIAICITRGTTTELNAVDFFTVSSLRYRPKYFDSGVAAAAAYQAGRCGALTTDRSGLAAMRASFKNPEAHVVLPEVISKEPLGPMVRADDPAWANVVRWTLNCMINAEEMGISSNNISKTAAAETPAAKRLLGKEGEFGVLLGLDNNWCANIIRDIGNYAESYERHIGVNTRIGLERGVNSLWTDGGLLYAPPIR